MPFEFCEPCVVDALRCVAAIGRQAEGIHDDGDQLAILPEHAAEFGHRVVIAGH